MVGLFVFSLQGRAGAGRVSLRDDPLAGSPSSLNRQRCFSSVAQTGGIETDVALVLRALSLSKTTHKLK
jgi:hypothetical protein